VANEQGLRIQAQVELVAELICTERDALKAYRRLEKLTCILAKHVGHGDADA
jgi:hypothetical protein